MKKNKGKSKRLLLCCCYVYNTVLYSKVQQSTVKYSACRQAGWKAGRQARRLHDYYTCYNLIYFALQKHQEI